MMVNWLVIALVFFAVTAALAVGPLFVWRLFLGAGDEGHPQRQKSSPFLILTAVGAMLFAVVAALFLVRVERQAPATVEQQATATAVDTTPARAERSLFAVESAPEPSSLTARHSEAVAVRPAVWVILLPVLVVTGVLALGRQPAS